MEQPYDPSKYHDEYQERLKELISQKIAGKEVVVPKSEPHGNVINLMEALQASIEKNKAAASANNSVDIKKVDIS